MDGSPSPLLASLKGSLTPDPANGAGPALDPRSAPGSLAWIGAGLRPGTSLPFRHSPKDLP